MSEENSNNLEASQGTLVAAAASATTTAASILDNNNDSNHDNDNTAGSETNMNDTRREMSDDKGQQSVENPATGTAVAGSVTTQRQPVDSESGLQYRIAELEKLLNEERQSKEHIQNQHKLQVQILKADFDTERSKWDREKQKEVLALRRSYNVAGEGTQHIEQQYEKKLQAVHKRFESEKSQWQRLKAKELSTAQNSVKKLENAMGQERERGKREIQKVQSKLDKTCVQLQEYKAKSKELEKQLKKKDKVLQKATNCTLTPYSRKRKRILELENNNPETPNKSGENDNTMDENDPGDYTTTEATTTTGDNGGDAAAAAAAASIVDLSTPSRGGGRRGSNKSPKIGKHDINWAKRFDEIQAYYKEHGHSNVPSNYKSKELSAWVSTQRTAYRFYKMGDYSKTSITMERIQKLKSVGFVFTVNPPPRNWDDRYNDLVEYSKQNGNCNVPQKFPGGLGEFVLNCRRKYRKGLLPEEKIQKLESLGFQWSLRNRGGSLEDRMTSYATKQVDVGNQNGGQGRSSQNQQQQQHQQQLRAQQHSQMP